MQGSTFQASRPLMAARDCLHRSACIGMPAMQLRLMLSAILPEDTVMHHLINLHLIKFLLAAKLAVFAAVFLHHACQSRKTTR